MKTLFLIRHAKSCRDDPALADQQRPLTRRGRRNASDLGKRLAKRAPKPDLMLSSPALRALKTAQLMARQFGYKRKHIVVDARLYACTAADLLRVIHQLDERLKRVMLFGHNPELTGLARRFSRDLTQLPTCAVARFRFDVKSWSDIGRGSLVGVALELPERSPDGNAR
ncbi:MAG: SixA phosphatase family protein [Steroidobacterales bacterium]